MNVSVSSVCVCICEVLKRACSEERCSGPELQRDKLMSCTSMKKDLGRSLWPTQELALIATTWSISVALNNGSCVPEQRGKLHPLSVEHATRPDKKGSKVWALHHCFVRATSKIMAIKHQLQTTVIQQAISGQYEKVKMLTWTKWACKDSEWGNACIDQSKGQFHRKGNSCNKACTQTYFDVPIPQSLLHLLADFCCLVQL